MSEIIQDYGKTVDPGVYIRALQGHQYIPQADQCIRDRIHEYGASSGLSHIGILDVGCGPGRLTRSLAHRNATVVGLDDSAKFIQYAQNDLVAYEEILPGSVSFEKMDFTRDPLPKFEGPVESDGKWNVLVAQGVLHHMHGNDRIAFFRRCYEALQSDGILIVGDEFIPRYTTPEDRRLKVAAFYLHIIAEASKGGFRELVTEEAKNFIDDVFSGEKGCGYADEKLLARIEKEALIFNDAFFNGVDSGLSVAPIRDGLKQFIPEIRQQAERLADVAATTNFNRGDYKVSIEALRAEMGPYGLVLKEKYEIGPVQQLGGMGVLVLVKA